MPTVYLHIGTLKTGTTSIQSFMTHNREKLLQKGYLYPASGTGQTIHHRRFCETIVSRRPDDPATNEWIEEWESLEREIDLHQPDHVVISAEGICSFDRGEVKLLESYLSRYLSGYEIKIIIYLRRQDDLLVSLYSQRVKQGQYWGSLKDSYKEGVLLRNGYTHGESHIRECRFDYYELLKPWAETFGKDNIVVRSYDGAKKDLINDFLEVIDLSKDEDWQYTDLYKNQKRSGKTIKSMRLLNFIFREQLSKSRKECIKLRRGKTGKILNLTERILNFIFSNDLASDKERRAVFNNFEDANRKVAQHYLGSVKLF